MNQSLNPLAVSLSEKFKNKGGLNELALFAGAGGGILGSHLLGCTTVCAVERDAYAAQVLAQRQNDGILPAFPIWSDIKSFDGRPWRGIVDVISGGFPCQDISSAGKGAGIDGERSGLWSEMARIISEVRPREVWVENSPMLVSRGLARVIGDLTQMGYDAHWTRFSASNFGAPHQRDRLWIVAYTKSIRCEKNGLSIRTEQKKSLFGIDCEDVGNTSSERCDTWRHNNRKYDRHITCTTSEDSAALANTESIGWQQTREDQQSLSEWSSWKGEELSNTSSLRLQGQGKSWFSSDPAENQEWQTDRTFYECVGHIWGIKSRLGRVADGVAHRVDRLKAIGNGQVPIVAKSAFKYLGGGL